MDNLDLNTLGLARKWPKLDRLQTEVADLQKRLSSAENQVRQLEGALAGAREKDLSAAATALRRGKETPVGVHEDSAKRALEAASKDRDVLQKATESAQGDLAQFTARHQTALFEDVVGARAEIAREVAGAAQTALQGFARWSDMHYLLRDLQPVEEVSDYTGPPNPNSVHVIGVHTRGSQGPDRGHVEGILRHLISLAGETGAANAA